jgi:hypothetical protein
MKPDDDPQGSDFQPAEGGQFPPGADSARWLRTESYVRARSHWDETDGSNLVSPSAGMARFARRKTRQLMATTSGYVSRR